MCVRELYGSGKGMLLSLIMIQGDRASRSLLKTQEWRATIDCVFATAAMIAQLKRKLCSANDVH